MKHLMLLSAIVIVALFLVLAGIRAAATEIGPAYAQQLDPDAAASFGAGGNGADRGGDPGRPAEPVHPTHPAHPTHPSHPTGPAHPTDPDPIPDNPW